MNDLIRPTLYDAYHDIVPVAEPKPDAARIVADVVGPVCETGDYLALERELPAVEAGDLLAVMTAGAYGAVQVVDLQHAAARAGSSGQGGEAAVVRPRQSYEELIGLDRFPDWLGGSCDGN